MEIKYSVFETCVTERGDFSRYGLTAADLDDLAGKASESQNVEHFPGEAIARAAFEERKRSVDTTQYGPGVSGYNGPHLEASVLYLYREEWNGEDYDQGEELDFYAKALSPVETEA